MRRGAAICAALLLACGTPAFGADAALTIYVEDALPNGHVFVSLSDGTAVVTRGFYSQHKSVALLGLGGGVVRDDAASPWTVRKTFAISEADYRRALDAIASFQAGKPRWCISRHCGDFAQGIAAAAGVTVALPWGATGKNRPGLFERALLKLGAEPNPAYQPAASRAFVRVKRGAAALRRARASEQRLEADAAGAQARIADITAAYHREYDPRYAAYRARCSVALPEDQVAARKAECEPEWSALEAIRLRYDAQLAPVRRVAAALDGQAAAEREHVAAETSAVDGGLNELAALHALDPDCRGKTPLEAQADCAGERRGRVH